MIKAIAKKQRQRFERTILMIDTLATCSTQMVIPTLTAAERKEANGTIAESLSAMRALAKKVKNADIVG